MPRGDAARRQEIWRVRGPLPAPTVRGLCGNHPKRRLDSPETHAGEALSSLDLAVGSWCESRYPLVFKRVQILWGGCRYYVTSIGLMVYGNMQPRNVPVKRC